MLEAEHLEFAQADRAVALRLAASSESSDRRWAVTAAFYAAHHYVHAILDHYSKDLPPTEIVDGLQISFSSPSAHGMRKGGTRYSLRQLSLKYREFEPLNEIFRVMLAESYRARYGLVRLSGEDYSSPAVQLALDRLDELRATLATHLGLK